ncbi:MAG: hypothetical protein H0T47_01025 [Planctomycetaceae bacterium]|nr:hypothetical protein [Planctomycetaceae bacterium]
MRREPGFSDERVNPPSVPEEKPSFRQIVAAGFRTVNAVWLAPVLLFVILAPQQTGACAELLALRASGRQLPPWLIAMAIIGHLSLIWWLVVLLGLPWVVGGAAARFADHLIPPERRRSYVERANHFYGRSFVLLILLGVLLAALFLPLYAVPTWLMIRDELFSAEPDFRAIRSAFSHPAMLACTIAWWLAAAVVIMAWDLIVAAMAIEDMRLSRAVQRGLFFMRDHPADTARFWLFVMLIGLPDLLLQQAMVLVPMAAIPLMAIAIGTATYNAYAIMLTIAVAESLSLAQRPPITAG